jgi:hypothetical protein
MVIVGGLPTLVMMWEGGCSANQLAEPWIPKDGREAVKKFAGFTSMSSPPELLEFAKTVRANYVASSPTEAVSEDSDPIEPSV